MLASSVTLPLLAAKFWEKKPYQEWAKKEAVAVLEDSPWGKLQRLHSRQAPATWSPAPGGDPEPKNQGGREQESSPLNSRRWYNIRFQSAKPVRMALARIALLYRRRDHRQAGELVRRRPFGEDYIVVAVSGAKGETDLPELNRANLHLLQAHTALVLKRSNRRIKLERYVSPREARSSEAFFLFPKMKDGKDQITLKEQEIRFVCQLSLESRLDRKFKLKNMVFRGILEL